MKHLKSIADHPDACGCQRRGICPKLPCGGSAAGYWWDRNFLSPSRVGQCPVDSCRQPGDTKHSELQTAVWSRHLSQSSSYQNINGHESSSSTIGYTYSYKAVKAGTVTIGAAKMNVGGRSLSTKPIRNSDSAARPLRTTRHAVVGSSLRHRHPDRRQACERQRRVYPHRVVKANRLRTGGRALLNKAIHKISGIEIHHQRAACLQRFYGRGRFLSRCKAVRERRRRKLFRIRNQAVGAVPSANRQTDNLVGQLRLDRTAV